MTAYVIAYSIIMFLVTAVSLTLCCLSIFGRKRQKVKSVRSEEGIAAEVFGNGGETAYLLLDEKTRKPVFVSPNIVNFFGVSAERVYVDLDCLKINILGQFTRGVLTSLRQWDKKSKLNFEFGYGDGKLAYAEFFVYEIGGVSYLAIAIHDITEYKNSLDELHKELDSALEQAAAKSSFLSSMSHEIRTPMNGVMGMMSLARMNIDDKKKVLNYLERAGELSVFLLSIINDVLDISKIESGKMQLFNTDMDIYAFAEKIKSMFYGTITSKGIDFTVQTVDILSRYVLCDEMRLTQVVTNLISNAGKFTPAGGKIDLTIKQLDKINGNVQLMIRVRDTGKGIAPENLHKIMRPFEQEEASTAHRYGGTGLGLAICDNIVKLMGGNIVVDSTLGKGTDFSVFLSVPESEAIPDCAPSVGSELKVAADDFTFKDCRILLAEDNDVNAEIAVDILESEGAIVTLAHDGREALDIFTRNPAQSFDLILMDIQMPRMDGRQAAAAIRNSDKADAQSVPIIALSADAFVEDVKLSENAGMDGHVAKPIDFDELRKRSGEVIALKKAE